MNIRKVIFFLLIVNSCFGQTIQFEDKILETKLLKEFEGVLKSRTSNIDLNNNGTIEISEALNVQEINLKLDSCLTTLNDFKYFKNLIALSIKNSLFEENIGSLTLNLNSFTELQFLLIETACINNINVSNCSKLKKFVCSISEYNPIKINGLSDCVELEEFELTNYYGNILDLSSNGKLTSFILYQDNNFNNNLINIIFPKENNIDLLGLFNIKLDSFSLESFRKIKEIKIENSDVKEIKTENLQFLESLICSNNQIEFFTLKDNLNLKYVYLCNNTIKNITFDIKKSNKLKESVLPQNLYQVIIQNNPEFKNIVKPESLIYCNN